MARCDGGKLRRVEDRYPAAVLAAVVLSLWWIAASAITGVTNMASNLAQHAAGITVLLGVLLVPSLTRSLDRRLAAHP